MSYTITELADLLRITRRYLHKLIAQGRGPVRQEAGRVSIADAIAWTKERIANARTIDELDNLYIALGNMKVDQRLEEIDAKLAYARANPKPRVSTEVEFKRKKNGDLIGIPMTSNDLVARWRPKPTKEQPARDTIRIAVGDRGKPGDW